MAWVRAVVAGPLLVASQTAGPPAEPTVTIASAPTTDVEFSGGPCSDAIRIVQEARAFIVNVTPAPSAELEVDLELVATRGSAGESFGALPGSVTVAAGETSAEVPVPAGPGGERSELVEIAGSVAAGLGYVVGDPATASIQFVSRRDPERDVAPVDCSPWFQLADVASNRAQTIRVGQRPADIVLSNGTTGGFRLHQDGGSLPLGVSIIGPDVSNSAPSLTAEEHAVRTATVGRFGGAATTTGTFVAELRACPFAIVFHCRTTTLQVTVLPGTPVVLGRTG